MNLFAFVLAFFFTALAGAHGSLILERKQNGENVPLKEYIWTLVDAAIGLYWMFVLAGGAT